jgi:hypothetical protein
VHFEFVTLQEHANVFAAMMNNSQPVNFINGFIKDLSGAAMHVQKEAKVCSNYLYCTCFFVHCSFFFVLEHLVPYFGFGHCNHVLLFPCAPRICISVNKCLSRFACFSSIQWTSKPQWS